MNDAAPRIPHERWLLALVLVTSLILCFGRLGTRALWDQDEGMHAATTLDMLRTGDWVTPHFNGETFYDKPILYNWMAAVAFEVLGPSELAARLPAALCGFGGIVITFLLGRRLYGSGVGILGAGVLATSVEQLALSRVVVHDMAVAFCTTLAFFFFWCGLDDEAGRRRWFLLFCAASALAVLAKGPVGFVPGFVGLVYLVCVRRLALLRELPWIPGLALFLVIAMPWYVMMSVRNDDFLAYFLRTKVFGALYSSEPNHEEAVWFYFRVLALGFLPWTLPLLFALWNGARRWRRLADERALFLLVWLGVIFAGFSLSSEKLPTYVLPLWPAGALLIGVLLRDLMAGAAEPLAQPLGRPFSRSWAALIGAIALGSLVFLLIPTPEGLERVGIPRRAFDLLGALASVGLGLSALAWWQRRWAAGVAAVLVTSVGIGLGFSYGIAPAVDEFRSSKTLAAEIDARLPPGAPIPFFKRVIGIGDSTLFYTDRRAVIVERWEIADYMRADERVYLVAEDRHIDDVIHEDGVTPNWVTVGRFGTRQLLSNRQDRQDDPGQPGGTAGS